MKTFLTKKTGGIALLFAALLPLCAAASGGIMLNTTRIIYPLDAKQTSVSVRNTSDKNAFLVQSWVEDNAGNKSKEFVITPPLYTSRTGNENMLRLIRTGGELPRDRESLYFFNSKAIPSLDKKELEGKNTLILAAITRIKLFVRPAGLKPAPDLAPAELRFKKTASQLEIHNPTPYYLTLTDIKAGNKKLNDIMVAPFNKDAVPLPAGSGSDITFSTINDYGAVTSPQKGMMQ